MTHNSGFHRIVSLGLVFWPGGVVLLFLPFRAQVVAILTPWLYFELPRFAQIGMDLQQIQQARLQKRLFLDWKHECTSLFPMFRGKG